MPKLYFLVALAIAVGFTQPETKAQSNRRQSWDDTTFLLSGKITGQTKGQIKLIYTNKNGEYILDSSTVKKGRFKFRGHIAEPTMVFLEGSVQEKDMKDPNFTSFYLDPAEIKISLVFNDFKKAVITGSKTQDENVELTNSIAPVQKE